MNALRLRRASTRGSNSARYCYSVWLRHLVLLNHYGFTIKDAQVAELRSAVAAGKLAATPRWLWRPSEDRLPDERAATSSAPRLDVAALAEDCKRLAQRRGRDPELLGEIQLARQLLADVDQSDGDRLPETPSRHLRDAFAPDGREHHGASNGHQARAVLGRVLGPAQRRAPRRRPMKASRVLATCSSTSRRAMSG